MRSVQVGECCQFTNAADADRVGERCELAEPVEAGIFIRDDCKQWQRSRAEDNRSGRNASVRTGLRLRRTESAEDRDRDADADRWLRNAVLEANFYV